MKKLLALTLALVMLLSFAACGGAVSDDAEKKDATSGATVETPNPASVQYVEENKGDLVDGMTAEAVGDGIVFTYKAASLEEGKKEVSELKWVELICLNTKGEAVLTITAGK